MSTQTLTGAIAPPKYPTVECRAWERFPCGLQTTCQPIAARGDHELSWSAHIRDLSQGGVGVVLKRRFERGAGLAIEIPESDSSSATTLLGRVVHTTSLPGGIWLHGCAFVSPLSEDELNRLLNLGQPQQESPESRLIQEVTLEGLDGQGPRLVRRMHLKGNWPLASGTVLKIWFGKAPHSHALLRIEHCVELAGRWFLFYTFFDSPSPEIKETFGG